jgi:flavin-dependent dehydrogenase
VFSSEVIVVGGGPAGSAAAIWCAQRGLRVVLIEREIFPRHRPGETLHPGIEPLLDQLGVKEAVLKAGFLRHKGYQVRWEDARSRFTAYGQGDNGPWESFQAWRAEFDTILMNRAHEVGVRVIQPCRANRVLTEQGRVIGTETDTGKLKAAFLVDATGDRHWLATRLRLVVNRSSPPLSASYGYIADREPSETSVPEIEADKNGWIWIAPARRGVWSWTRLNFDPKTKGKLPCRFRSLRSIERSGGANVTWRQVTLAAAPGYFIVGDAATVLDPASSHGVLRAIMSAIKAAHSIVQIFRGFPESIATREFNRWITDWFNHDVRALKALYQKHPNRPGWITGDFSAPRGY